MASTLQRPSENASLIKQVADELRLKVTGEVRFDDLARALYATDASPYELYPYGVVLPKTVEDIAAVVKVANRHKLPILPRGGGTSLAGQTVAEAIVLDFSKYMTEVLDFNAEERWVKVQPGVVRDNLNLFLAPHDLQFTPDISTTNRANVGGMVANNSAGTRSIKYGKSVDAVLKMTVMLADGTITELHEVDDDTLKEKLELPGFEGDAYRTVHRVVTEHADEIEARFPKVMRRVGGYNLDEFTNGKPFNLAKLVSGSEGTLAIILDVTLRLEPVPTHSLIALLHFDTLEKALTAVQHINKHGPSAVEILDDNLFKLGLENPTLAPLLWWLEGEPAAVLLVEFDGTSEEEMLSGLKGMQDDPKVADLSYHTYLARDKKEQKGVLEFRKGGLGIYATVKGNEKPVPFIEDSAIPVENLPKYIPEVLEVCRKENVKAVIYAHASVGVIHCRPHLDLKTEEGIRKFQKISEEVFKLVKTYGGSWSGEHGDGFIRSYQNPELFGATLYQDFQAIKRAFDPDNLMNPGKIVDAPPMTENLRYGTDYEATPMNTYLDFRDDEGYLGAIEMCTGVGACRKTTTGVMCPSYIATRDEDHSTRGRANILREAITGQLPGGLTSREVYDVLDLCLACKACKSECPSRVDMAKIKYEFLQHYYDDHGTPLSARIFGHAYRTAPLGRAFAPIANRVLPSKPFRWALEKTLGVDRRRVLPLYAEKSFGSLRKKRTAPSKKDKTVALFADTWTMYHETGVGVAAVKVLEALGYDVRYVPYSCCGRTLLSKGLLKDARNLAQRTVQVLGAYAKAGVPVVGLEPSCVTAFTEDYPDLIPGDLTDLVAKNVKMIDQFLAKAWTSGELTPEEVFRKNGAPIMFHGHCQQRAAVGSGPSLAVLGWVSDEVHEVDSSCCGMAGSFGYDHYDISMQIGEHRLFPGAREHEGEIAACGFSCRHQIKDGAGKSPKHVIEMMAEALYVNAE